MKDNTIKEAYCSYKVAELLNQKGFDGECHYFFRCHDQSFRAYRPSPSRLAGNPMFTCNREWLKKHTESIGVDYVLAPTLQMACAWLRESKNIKIFMPPGKDGNGNLGYLADVWAWNENEGQYEPYWANFNPVYEKAVEAALEYALTNLI